MRVQSWFEVDRAGLAKLLEQRGVAFVLWELLANAWDAPHTSQVDVTFAPMVGVPKARLVVVDDAPEGFTRLEHAWTLFAESEHKGNPNDRGRWNLGEKSVLAMCASAEIVSTSGGVRFDAEGRHLIRARRDRGSEFRATLRCTREQYEEIVAAAQLVVPPAGIVVTFNGAALTGPTRVQSLEAELPTEYADGEGVLRRSRRTAVVELLAGADGWIYELGIPVMQTGDRWCYNVLQKVPLTVDRTAVTAAFLRELRVAVLNVTAEHLTADEASAP
jgi:hypothetical protein